MLFTLAISVNKQEALSRTIVPEIMDKSMFTVVSASPHGIHNPRDHVSLPVEPDQDIYRKAEGLQVPQHN